MSTTLEQTTLESTGDLSGPVLQVVSDIISDIRARISAEVNRAGQSESPRLREALAAMRESVRAELCESLRDEFEARFRESMEIAKRQFKEKLRDAMADAEKEQNRLREEVAATRERAAEISAELLSKESELEHMNRETPSMLEDPDIDLARIMRHKAMVTELSAYVKGLQYNSDESTSAKSADVSFQEAAPLFART
jgi:hypothetical protein